MADLETLYQNIQTVKNEYIIFQWSKTVENYKSEYQKALINVISEIKSYKPRMQHLILQTLEASSQNKVDGHATLEWYFTNLDKTISIPLYLDKMFRAWYSTNVDLEIQEDIENMQWSNIFDVKQKEGKPLLTWRKNEEGDPIINDKLGELTLETKHSFALNNIPKEPRFQKKIELIPLNTMGLGEMQNLETYEESDRLPDQLAYYFYKQIDDHANNFYWLGDHIHYGGINGLSVAIYKLLRNYVYAGENTYKQYM